MKKSYNKSSFSNYWKNSGEISYWYTFYLHNIIYSHVTFYVRKVYIRGELLRIEEPYSWPRVP